MPSRDHRIGKARASAARAKVNDHENKRDQADECPDNEPLIIAVFLGGGIRVFAPLRGHPRGKTYALSVARNLHFISIFARRTDEQKARNECKYNERECQNDPQFLYLYRDTGEHRHAEHKVYKERRNRPAKVF